MSLKDIAESLKTEKQSSAGDAVNMRIHTIPTLKILNVKVPIGYIDTINDHIDNVVIPNNKSFADGLVGQINQDKKSAQLDFPFDTEFGKEFKKFM